MRQDSVNYLAVGLFVVAVFAALLVVLFRLTGHGEDTASFYVAFDDITGIAEGSDVTYEGYRIGRVIAVDPQRSAGHTSFRLALAVKPGWQIPVDSKAQITAPSLLADYLVNIAEGSSSQLLEPGGTLEGVPAVNIVELFDTIATEVVHLSESQIKPLLAELRGYLGSVGGGLQNVVPGLVEETSALLDSLREASQSLSSLLGPDNVGRVDRFLVNAEAISVNLKDISTGFKDASAQLDQLLRNSNAIVNENNHDVRQAVSMLRETMDTMAHSVDGIIYNLEGTSRNLNEFSRQLRENPAVLFGRRPPPEEARVSP